MKSCFGFQVRRSAPVAVQPARPTPMEVKRLSDWDNRLIMHFPIPVILVYKHSGAVADKDPAKIIKNALAEALVYYYPWAGRIKDGADGSLLVDCTAEGVVFVEADADITLDQLGDYSAVSPFPWIEKLLCKNDTGAELGYPLFTMQVTRMLCGGFILTFTFLHVMSDGFGVGLFLTAITELAGGASKPSVLPVWHREQVLRARDHLYHTALSTSSKSHVPEFGLCMDDDCIEDTFFFGPRQVASIQARMAEHLQKSCTNFELIAACLLHCHVTAFKHAPEEEVRFVFPVNCRSKFVERPIPEGYYGNASFDVVFFFRKQQLHDLSHAVEAIKRAKEAVTEGFAQSMVDDEFIRRRTSAPLNLSHHCTTIFCNDWSRVGFSNLDFGSFWGKPIFVATQFGYLPFDIFSLFVPFTNQNGEHGKLLAIKMSKHELQIFSNTLRNFIGSC